jgi:hypothetical protein
MAVDPDKQYLFIGGPMDGKIKYVDHNVIFSNHQDPKDPARLESYRYRYVLKALMTNEVFILDSIDLKEAIKMLIEGYKPNGQ